MTTTRYRFVIEAIVLLVLICLGLVWVAPSPLLPAIMAEYGVSRGTVSWLLSIASLVVAVFTIPAGILAARIGTKKTFAIGAILQAAGIFTPVLPGFAPLLTSRFIFAVGTAMTFTIAAGIVARWFSSKELPVVNGFNISSTSLGNAIALFSTVPLAAFLNWRGVLTAYGVVALIGGIAWLFLGKEQPGAIGRTSAAVSPPHISITGLFKQRTTLLLAVSMAGPFSLFMAISSWLPTYFNQVFDMPLAKASSITALFTLFSIPASLGGGLLTGWVGLRRPFLIIPGVLIGLAGMGTFLFNSPVVIYLSVALFGICVQLFMAPAFTLAMELPGMTPQTATIVLAVAVGIGNFGGFLGPIVVGYLTDLTGSYLPGLIGISVFSTSLLVGGLLLPETGPKARKAKVPRHEI